MHLFVSVARRQWELQSLQRAAEICNTLVRKPDDLFLSGYMPMCVQMNRSLSDSFHQPSNRAASFNPVDDNNVDDGPYFDADISAFGWFVSAAPPASYCPSFTALDLKTVPSGWYTLKSYSVRRSPFEFFSPCGTGSGLHAWIFLSERHEADVPAGQEVLVLQQQNARSLQAALHRHLPINLLQGNRCF